MGKRSLLASIVLTLILSVTPAPAHATCQSTSGSGSSCGASATNTGSGVDLRAERSTWESSQRTAGGGSQAGGGSSASSAGQALSAEQLRNIRWWQSIWERIFAQPTCVTRGNCPDVDEAAQKISSVITVTSRDVASFIPRAPGATSEPERWTVVDLPTNFIMSASTHTVPGTLLGFPAEVRFHPIQSLWFHSDGAQVTAQTLGAKWASLGQREFTNTATAHVYRELRSYHIDTAVVYRAEYRVNGGEWTDVEGTIRKDGPRLFLEVMGADTVLVARTCHEGHPGPGC